MEEFETNGPRKRTTREQLVAEMQLEAEERDRVLEYIDRLTSITARIDDTAYERGLRLLTEEIRSFPRLNLKALVLAADVSIKDEERLMDASSFDPMNMTQKRWARTTDIRTFAQSLLDAESNKDTNE